MTIRDKKKKWSRRQRIVCVSAAVILLFPLALVHAIAGLFSLHDRVMKPYASHVITDGTGHTIRYYELDQSNADWNIVYIHGTPASGAIFGEQFRRPYPQANLYSLDRPGFGASKPALRRPSLDDQAEAVGGLLRKLDGKPVILVGHSYGGPVALLAALKFTNQVAGVVLIGGSVDPAQEHIYTIQHVANWPLLSWLVPQALRQCNRELLTLRGDLVALKPRIASLSVPVVMLHGQLDKQVPIANVNYLREQLGAAGKTNLFDALIYSNYNHFIPWEHPDAVEAALKDVTTRATFRSQNR